MCGIFATIDASQSRGKTCTWVCDANRIQAHRGPDGSGAWGERFLWHRVTLGMTRLRISDQDTPIEVPYRFPELKVVLAYNGEIYNADALRRELPGPWSTRCDAEVLAAAWREWGPACLHRVAVLFAFVLLDQTTGEGFIARDRAGEKPLYWTERNKRLYLASEIKALPVALEPAPCPDMETLEFDCRRDTPFRGVQAREPGCAMHSVEGRPYSAYAWWKLPEVEQDPGRSYDDLVEEMTYLIRDAIRIRSLAEIPVAVQISGGLDSAIIQQVAKADGLYCVHFPKEGIDLTESATLAANGRDVKFVTFNRYDMETHLPIMVRHLDTPSTWTAVCQWFLHRRISEDGYKIALSGEGADELFGGYIRYRLLWHLDRMMEDRHLRDYGPLASHMFHDVLPRMLCRGRTWTAWEYAPARGLKHPQIGVARATAMMLVDWHTTMQVLLRMADRMGMAHGVESRSPYLDYRVIEAAARLPVKYKITTRYSKYILRDVAARLGVSEKIILESGKRGLFLPWSHWHRQQPENAGDRGVWDRSGFAELMRKTWLQSCMHATYCERCRDR